LHFANSECILVLEQIFNNQFCFREDGNDVDQKRMQVRERNVPAQPVQVKSQEDSPEDEYDDVWPMRISSSARRYQGLADVRTEVGRTRADVQSLASQRTYRAPSTVPPRRAATQGNIPIVQGQRHRITQSDDVTSRHSDQLELSEPGAKPRLHWMVFVGMAMFTMLIGWVALTTLANWWQVTQDDWHYGRPRTYQIDQVVGHNDSAVNPSHFIALNLNRHIQVIEFPGNDSSKAKVYIGPTLIGPGQELAVVTLSFKDVNGDGRLDMIINVQDSHIVFINENGQFRPARPGENIQL
jgi:hypothetical protein